MSHSDVPSIRRHRLLVRLRELFGEIDAAFARGDFETARLNNREVAELLEELVQRPVSRSDPMRSSGVQARDETTQDGDEESRSRAS